MSFSMYFFLIIAPIYISNKFKPSNQYYIYHSQNTILYFVFMIMENTSIANLLL